MGKSEAVSIAGGIVTLSALYGLLIFLKTDGANQAEATPLSGEAASFPLVLNTWFFSNATAEGNPYLMHSVICHSFDI